jgi:hypothetical protein
MAPRKMAKKSKATKKKVKAAKAKKKAPKPKVALKKKAGKKVAGKKAPGRKSPGKKSAAKKAPRMAAKRAKPAAKRRAAPRTAFHAFLSALSKATDHEGVLGEDFVVYPPEEDVGYSTTPLNAVVFGSMGVDGVHYAILKIDGAIRHESPVIHVSPMDFDDPYALLGPTFADYLAIGCGVSRKEIEDLLAAEESGRSSLLEFLRAHFEHERLWPEGQENGLGPYADLIVPRPEDDQLPAPASARDLKALVPAGVATAGDEVDRLFPGYDSPERSSDWEALKSRLSIGSTIRGTVVARWPIGVLVDIGVGFPALLSAEALKDAKRRDYLIPIEEYPAVGSVVEARIRQWADFSRTIGITQAENDD